MTHVLEEAGLYGNGLVRVNTPELVARYNRSLDALGIAPTSLSSFRIDGIGWSPEVAREKGDAAYLSHGTTHPMAILLTPDQYDKPVCESVFSFQRPLMRQYFQRFKNELADLTSHTGVTVELELGMSEHRNPLDLLMIQDVLVRTTVPPELAAAFEQQRSLVAQFNDRGDAWFDEGLRHSIIESAKQHGDMRARHWFIPNWDYRDTDYFHTSAFGGIYILRGEHKPKQMLIREDESVDVDYRGEVAVYSLRDSEWLETLLRQGVLEIPFANKDALRHECRRIRESLFAEVACHAHPEMVMSSLTAAQRTGLLNSLRDRIPAEYFELERTELKLERSSVESIKFFPQSLQPLLCHPAASLPAEKRRVLWQLLAQSRPFDVWRLYRHYKRRFYEAYARWPTSRQKWAVETIQQQLRGQGENE